LAEKTVGDGKLVFNPGESRMTQDIHNVVIIGSGPAGWTAALYAARATLRPLVFEGAAPNLPGGQLMMTSDVENYPGFPKGILGPELMELFKQQALRFGARTKTQNIASVDLSKRPFTVTTEEGEKVLARSIIISTGANAKLLGIPKEKELMAQGAGVSACATCDGAFYKNVEVAVIGGGDSAMEEANFLTRFASKVTIIHRRETFRASKIMIDRAHGNPKIHWELNQEIEEITTEARGPFNKQSLSGLRLKNVKSGETKELKVEGLFVAIGHKPNTELFEGKLELDEKGYLVTQGKSSKTNVVGVFACGDAQDSIYRQAVTAAGSGCAAAIDAERFLESEGH
jgi:thioredoxin reductase (NADPH)